MTVSEYKEKAYRGLLSASRPRTKTFIFCWNQFVTLYPPKKCIYLPIWPRSIIITFATIYRWKLEKE